MPQALILPMAAHVALTAFLYVLLTIARAPTVWGLGRRTNGSNPWSTIEPKISANLSNQFEWPLFFYVACLFLQFQATQTVVALAWIFVGGRILHSAVQIFTSNIRLRGLVFTINFLAVIGLWHFVVTTSGKAAAA
ncbi:MAPEG family protein (plasmid) [Nitrosomonas europaea]|uniref:MAPEG family protein n=1 Tax=Nitrosomonas europaea TaxID=915 RepID=UPI003266BA60